MSNFIVEPFPPMPKSGMSTGKIVPGVRVTDKRTGEYAIANMYRKMYLNRDAAIHELELRWQERQAAHRGREE